MKNMLAKLAIIVPCYNEEEVLETSAKTLLSVLNKLIKGNLVAKDSFICFVNDGSRDKTLDIIHKLARANPAFKGIGLSRNFGHQGALLSGLYSVDADIYVSIDADLQDSPDVIADMVKDYHKGSDVVYGVRRRRDSDSLFKRTTANTFYALMGLLGTKVIKGHADFRLMSRRAVETLKNDFPEHSMFLRALVPLVGFKSSMVYYDRTPRMAGESKYPFKKMVAFAIEGITSFSITPLRFVVFLGFFVCLVSFIFLMIALYKFFTDKVIHGWTSMVTLITFLGGVQLLSLGIIGEYIGKIYKEVKARPFFIVDEKIGFNPLKRLSGRG